MIFHIFSYACAATAALLVLGAISIWWHRPRPGSGKGDGP